MSKYDKAVEVLHKMVLELSKEERQKLKTLLSEVEKKK